MNLRTERDETEKGIRVRERKCAIVNEAISYYWTIDLNNTFKKKILSEEEVN